MKLARVNSIEEEITRITERFAPSNEFVVYGAGSMFRFMLDRVGDMLNIKICVDKSARFQEREWGNGFKIVSPDKLEDIRSEKVIIAANGEYYMEILNLLLKAGALEKNICSALELVSIWGLVYKNQIYSAYVSFPILSGCTLKCNGCIHYTSYHVKSFIANKEDVCADTDRYFACVDTVKEIQIFGGEPFLHKDVGKICEYISENYTGRYSEMLVTTNGTLIPSDEQFRLFSSCTNLRISISDYSKYSDSRLHIEELLEKCRSFGIKYELNSNFYRTDAENLWSDCGDPNLVFGTAGEEWRERFANCASSGYGVYGGKYFYCPNSMFAYITGIYPKGKDYLLLCDLLSLSKEERQKQLISWHLGYMDKKRLGFCSHCRGFGKKVNQHFISAGQQLN